MVAGAPHPVYRSELAQDNVLEIVLGILLVVPDPLGQQGFLTAARLSINHQGGGGVLLLQPFLYLLKVLLQPLVILILLHLKNVLRQVHKLCVFLQHPIYLLLISHYKI